MRRTKLRYFAKAEESDMDGGGDNSGDDSGSKEENTWPDTWRENYAGEDEGKLSKLANYASPNAAFDAMISAQTKISSGEFKSTNPFPTEGKDEEKALWRSENGIPESSDKYDMTFDSGLVVGDDDKPMIDSFLSSAHTNNMSPDHAKATVQWYYDNEQKMKETQAEIDAQSKVDTEDALRAEWGNEYRSNINRVHGLLDTAPEGLKDKILTARMEDGTPLFSNPDTLKYFIDMALQINPATTLVPGAGDNIAGAITDEIASIEKMQGSKNSDYWKGPKSDGIQKRYRELLTAQEKMTH